MPLSRRQASLSQVEPRRQTHRHRSLSDDSFSEHGTIGRRVGENEQNLVDGRRAWCVCTTTDRGPSSSNT